RLHLLRESVADGRFLPAGRRQHWIFLTFPKCQALPGGAREALARPAGVRLRRAGSLVRLLECSQQGNLPGLLDQLPAPAFSAHLADHEDHPGVPPWDGSVVCDQLAPVVPGLPVCLFGRRPSATGSWFGTAAQSPGTTTRRAFFTALEPGASGR